MSSSSVIYTSLLKAHKISHVLDLLGAPGVARVLSAQAPSFLLRGILLTFPGYGNEPPSLCLPQNAHQHLVLWLFSLSLPSPGSLIGRGKNVLDRASWSVKTCMWALDMLRALCFKALVLLISRACDEI